jgi:hypothetical protein
MTNKTTKPRKVAQQIAAMVAPAKKLNMDPNKADNQTMGHIAARAIRDMQAKGFEKGEFDALDVHMDLCAVHLNGCPLRLGELLDADDFNFWHDIAGIRRHLNRETGELVNCFLPRFSKRRG